MGTYAYDEDTEEAQGVTGQELMEIDGKYSIGARAIEKYIFLTSPQMGPRTPSFFTKINSITRRPLRCMEKMSRLWCKRRMRSP